jgi:hypothetical protein
MIEARSRASSPTICGQGKTIASWRMFAVVVTFPLAAARIFAVMIDKDTGILKIGILTLCHRNIARCRQGWGDQVSLQDAAWTWKAAVGL